MCFSHNNLLTFPYQALTLTDSIDVTVYYIFHNLDSNNPLPTMLLVLYYLIKIFTKYFKYRYSSFMLITQGSDLLLGSA